MFFSTLIVVLINLLFPKREQIVRSVRPPGKDEQLKEKHVSVFLLFKITFQRFALLWFRVWFVDMAVFIRHSRFQKWKRAKEPQPYINNFHRALYLYVYIFLNPQITQSKISLETFNSFIFISERLILYQEKYFAFLSNFFYCTFTFLTGLTPESGIIPFDGNRFVQH